MKPAILLVEPMMDAIERELDAAYTVHRLYDASLKTRIQSELGAIRAAVTGGGTGLSADWVARLPALGLVAINGVGTDKVDLAETARRGIHVSTTPGVLTGDIADMAMALLLAVMRRIVEGDRLVRQGRWAAGGQLPLGSRLGGRRLGILGLGQIGRAIARRAEAFDAEILYWNRSPAEMPAGWTAVDTPERLAAEADILVVAVAATPQTESIVSAAVLAALGPEGILVNVARGNVVDETALLHALQQGTIAAAGLDVFRNEPTIDPAFAGLENVVLAPHQGSATLATREDMGRLVLANLADHFAGRTPRTSVNADRIRETHTA
ncbi:2-hydroxyacid dehydrogenase [Aureimonas altamirensis]|uniref:2-hydroxyacid dehydrogenase n=1 Tax=Aureimonas altamirensis TaxID=370622 RepID=UPI0020367E06|nr:2-hydroxyacid dehydrogenase [Aureimonas altamirensis]MCM2504887.1 2-hydroxyacid dehydrogenase [Aureimonas altamirensis]